MRWLASPSCPLRSKRIFRLRCKKSGRGDRQPCVLTSTGTGTGRGHMELDRKTLGRSKLNLSALGFGGTGLGNMYVAMSERSVIDTLSAAYAAGMRYYDTAPLYGHGLSELRLGSGLRMFADTGVVVSSKVGWPLRPAFAKPPHAAPFPPLTPLSPLHHPPS